MEGGKYDITRTDTELEQRLRALDPDPQAASRERR